MNTGQIIKSKTTERFTVIPNAVLEDKRLMLKEIGLLCFILKLPADWVLHKSRLHVNFEDGRDAVISAFDTLIEAGYIEAIKVKEAGMFKGFNYIVSDIPKHFNKIQRKPKPKKQETVPFPENPKPVEPKPGKAALLNTDKTKDFPLLPTNVDNKGRPNAKEKKLPSFYNQFIAVYDGWYKQNNDGTPPMIDGAQGNAAKSLIGHFKSMVKARYKKDFAGAEIPAEKLEPQTLDAWQLVLQRWEMLEPFYQDKTRLIDINSNIQIIVQQVKNGSKKQQSNGKKIGSDGISTMFAAVNAKYGQAGGG